jgi:imidazolonepropionase
MTEHFDLLIHNARIASLQDNSLPYGLIEIGALGVRDGLISFVGETSASSGFNAKEVIDAQGRLLTPALIDCHTHLVFAGDRAGEFEQRLNGVSYEEIARKGGGILSTVRATREASEDDLLAQSLLRAQALMNEGVASIEIKSGYGLDFDSERKMLRMARRIGEQLGITVRTTYLAAHALPPEFSGRSDDYINAVCDWMRVLHSAHLIDAVDAFCERIAFTPQQTERVFECARSLGLPVKLHADQLSDSGGAALCARFNGLSADHLEYTDETAVHAMKTAGTVAVLLPGSFHCLREKQLPPIDLFRKHQVPMAVSTDLNPGTSPVNSLLLSMSLACTHFRITPEEALRGATQHAARALGFSDRGILREGLRADLCLWHCQHPAELSYWLGKPMLDSLWVSGKQVV